MKRKSVLLLLALLAAALALAGCGGEESDTTPPGGEIPPIDINYPYEPDTPAPAPHEGTFVSDCGTMTFNGDGERVTIDFDEALAEWLGLPAGEQEATYQFFSGDLPPHGHVMVRYDAAMDFELTVGEGDDQKRVMIEVGKYEDGHYYTGTNCVTADRITFFVDTADDSGDLVVVDFLKEEA